MAVNQVEFDYLVVSIENGSYTDSKLDLSAKDIDDLDIARLVQALKANNSVAERITKLYLAHNKIGIPLGLEFLVNLEQLDLSYNYIVQPPNLNSSKLRRVNLLGNPISEVGKLAICALTLAGLESDLSFDDEPAAYLSVEKILKHIYAILNNWSRLPEHWAILAAVIENLAQISVANNLELPAIRDNIKTKVAELINLEQLIRSNMQQLHTIFLQADVAAPELAFIDAALESLPEIVNHLEDRLVTIVCYRIADAHERNANTDRAVVFYENAIFFDPAYIRSQYRLAVIEEQRNNLSRAKQLYLNACAIPEAFERIMHFVGARLHDVAEIIQCDITQDLMLDPITVASGRSFDRASLVRWIRGSAARLDPTRQSLEFPVGSRSRPLTRNILLRGLIEYALFSEDPFDITQYPKLKDPNTGTYFIDPYITLSGVTVEKPATATAITDQHLRSDYMVKNLLQHIKNKIHLAAEAAALENTIRLAAEQAALEAGPIAKRLRSSTYSLKP